MEDRISTRWTVVETRTVVVENFSAIGHQAALTYALDGSHAQNVASDTTIRTAVPVYPEGEGE